MTKKKQPTKRVQIAVITAPEDAEIPHYYGWANAARTVPEDTVKDSAALHSALKELASKAADAYLGIEDNDDEEDAPGATGNGQDD